MAKQQPKQHLVQPAIQGERFPLREPTLRAREQFLRVEKEYEDVLSRSVFNASELVKYLNAEEIRLIQETGEIPETVVQKLLANEEFVKDAMSGLTVEEEIRYTEALKRLAETCIDWAKTSAKPEALLDERLEEVLKIITLFRAKIGRRQ